MNRRFALIVLALAAVPVPASARTNLGLFGNWGAFADTSGPRCYAIAMAEKGKAAPISQAFASVGTWPRHQVRGQVYFRLSQPLAKGAAITLTIGGARFSLTGSGLNAWARDRQMDAAIVARLRSTDSMTLRSIGTSGRAFTDRYRLDGVASALDAATVGCARLR